MNLRRVRVLKTLESRRPGPVVYWMSRDQRCEDNWALLHAQNLALERCQPLLVVFCLSDTFLGATARQYGFMLRGLQETFAALAQKNIAGALLRGSAPAVLPAWLEACGASLLVTDFDPLRLKREWQRQVLAQVHVDCHEVDAHNLVPCGVASQKLEYGAYTLRPKIHRLLPEFLEPFAPLRPHPYDSRCPTPDFPVVDAVLASLEIDRTVAEVDWLAPGSAAAASRLHEFLADGLAAYAERSNDPAAAAQSQLSPYLHFGQLAPQRVVAEVLARTAGSSAAAAGFLEELIVRRELADNFCYYQPAYDSPQAFPAWAAKTLSEHLDDERDICYSLAEFEQGRTHDELWNAAQRQLLRTGKLHGYMRMYWAKKILEWSSSPAQAMNIAIQLNDKYELDGRDPNGYAGIAWSIGGVHDRAWSERKVFGKIRYMSERGLKRKFPVQAYLEQYC